MYSLPIRPNELYHYGMPRRSGRYPWGSGDRPYQSVNSSALSIYKLASEKEKNITKDIKEVAKNSNCKLYGLENRLKTVDSIQRKINKKQIEDGKSEKESAIDIHDSVRYTTISDTKDFVSNYELFKKNMSDRGYTETKCKNYFELFNQGLVKHKSVQSQFSTKDGFSFEVQFQTPESQEAKTKKIPLYEERRKVDINPKRAKELENEMEKLALKVPNPPGIEKIKSHSNTSLKHSQESEVKFKMNNIYYLSHGGPGSGRYPLGSGERPYQKFEGSRRNKSGLSGYIAKKREEKQRAEAIKKRTIQDLMEKDKDRVLRSGRASEVAKYKGQLSRQELQEVYNRLNLEKQIDRMSSTELLDNQRLVNNVISNIKLTTEWIAAGAVSYNTLASIYNAAVSNKDKKLPVLKISKN